MPVNNYDSWKRYIVYLIWAFFLFTFFYDFLYEIPIRSFFWITELILSVFIYYKFKIPFWVYFSILIIFLAHLFGELYFGLFYTLPYFDKWIHLFSPILACNLFYYLFEKKITDKKTLILFSVTFLLSFELIFELIEYFFDVNFNTLLQGVHNFGIEKLNSKVGIVMPRFEDTIYDMALNLLGSIIWAIGALFVLRKKSEK